LSLLQDHLVQYVWQDKMPEWVIVYDTAHCDNWWSLHIYLYLLGKGFLENLL